MWVEAVIFAVGLGYVAYRLSLTFRAVRADRAGERQRADALRAKGGFLFVGFVSALTLVLVVGVIVTVIAAQ